MSVILSKSSIDGAREEVCILIAYLSSPRTIMKTKNYIRRSATSLFVCFIRIIY